MKQVHWQYFEQKPFTKSQRATTTILFGGLTFKHDRLVGAVLQSLGYNTRMLHNATVDDFQAGKEYGNYGQCNPTYFTVGNLVNALKQIEAEGVSKQEIVDNYIFVTASSPCGPCRFGMYQNEYRLATSNAGFEGFRVLTFDQKQEINQSGEDAGLELSPHFFVSLLHAFNMGDVLNEVAYTIRPYEVNPGETDKVLEEAIQYLENVLRQRTPVNASSKMKKTLQSAQKVYSNIFGEELNTLLKALEHVGEMFDTINVDRTRVKTIVKITGEFWAQTTESDGNFNMFPFLEREGAAVKVEPVATWISYLLHQGHQELEDTKGTQNNLLSPNYLQKSKSYLKYFKNKATLSIAEKTFEKMYHGMVNALKNIPHNLIDQQEFAKLAQQYYDTRAAGGEGHLEVGKNIYYYQHGLCHMVLSLKPFGCMPSVQSDGAQSAVQGAYGDMIYLPIETSGEGEVNAHSRVQMALGEAKQKARTEFAKALEETGLTTEEMQAYINEHPEMKKPSFHLPQHNTTISVAANTAYYIKTQT